MRCVCAFYKAGTRKTRGEADRKISFSMDLIFSWSGSGEVITKIISQKYMIKAISGMKCHRVLQQ